MKKFIMLMSSVIALSLCFTASALEGNFTAKVRTIGLPDDQARVIAIAQFEDTDILTDGSFSVDFSVYQYEGLLFGGTATINADQTEVIEGKVATGRTKMTYDPETGRITARLVLKVVNGANNSSYDVGAYTSPSNSGTVGWGGYATISAYSFINIGDVIGDGEPVDVH
ncbi:hypothetical protein GCM10009133_09430 [Cocleimonas flava]|uniref:Uncharacterized protein n=3 Tax=Cocleimonas flava TaxID=634765 RepID=A0A4R1EZG4_9GAMM|nr:hypothetical protein EV695_1814 [Cocleimonas flava]